ncbi:bifunctional tRNA pseudouridine(32) synthase/23S rRNA pseudouridine(746) synthase RluA [Ignatzschineria sp. RMDPL8A]|uniref:bifunctional tRNA pseudouridine(32) synthase/23S rRNA pseudouridine(746) synthase RluA n=1 Tax=Ignatzschineria sp. RMDPL8A TaxID=2999236 RepID=UPI0024467B28|nr:bifunctional tRNA pseudouridine(32) synthase/23S rRNA pseudouridine(746) synthase RluA [Ignatzschineria sp. RMDPL8A]MDG9729248.1 bifunctional tRNA pseudouridine(32) synthase/23S rRNA pseudouridine(746) synthase RluA [Ignatzschineria sp. RMDPL8A]
MPFYYNPPFEPWLDILYEDDDILVINKPSGLLSVPGKGIDKHDSVMARVQWQHPYAEAAHRLDMATSGVMVIAITKAAERELKRQFRERETGKVYYASVWGHFEQSSGLIDLPLICDWPNRPKQMVSFERGKPAQTLYEVISETHQNHYPTTLVKLTPITGRSHQLRVHMLALGHPILGDNFYAHPEAFELAERLLLHAAVLEFTHPISGKKMRFETVIPFS